MRSGVSSWRSRVAGRGGAVAVGAARRLAVARGAAPRARARLRRRARTPLLAHHYRFLFPSETYTFNLLVYDVRLTRRVRSDVTVVTRGADESHATYTNLERFI